MEEALAREQALEQEVYALLNDPSQPIVNLLDAFQDYSTIYSANTIANFEHAEERQARLWQVHQQGRRFFSGHLKQLRMQRDERAVQTRQLIKAYLIWIKGAESAYRNYIHLLNAASGGIPELEKVAQRVKSDVASESSLTLSPSLAAPELRGLVLASCHSTLIHLGDLSRYRANDKLDKTPQFGPAIGFYGLADTIRPISGIGHHQQAVIHLEQKAHLRAIYELYRALMVDEPHPAAAQNLRIEFAKVNSAWEKGELIPKSAINNPEAPNRIVTGWFVRMHSLCAQGREFASRDELERELLTQLADAAKKDVPKFEESLMRMLMVNMAAQYHAASLFQVCRGEGEQAGRYQQAFYFFFRFNLKSLTGLLQLFHNSINTENDKARKDDSLAAKLPLVARRLLPALRVYSSWLTANVHLITGLAADVFLAEAIDSFWISYARAVGVLSDEDIFGVWALDDYDLDYMLPEDVDTLGFKPLQDEHQTAWRAWCTPDSAWKPRFSDPGVTTLSPDDEMLARIKGMLDDACSLAIGEETVPLGFVGGKIFHEKHIVNASAAAEEAKKKAAKPKPAPPPLSYAAAAQKKVASAKPTAKSTSTKPRHAEMAKMVDSTVEDYDSDNPVTPPSHATVQPPIGTKGNATHRSKQKGAQNAFSSVPIYQPDLPSWRTAPAVQPPTAQTPPSLRTPKEKFMTSSAERLQSVSGLWNGTAAQPMSSGFPAGLSTGTLSSPQQDMRHGHSRNNSATSNRSRTSMESGAHMQPDGHGFIGITEGYTSFSESNAASPLLFGAGGGIWSTGAGDGAFWRTSPQNGQNPQRKPGG